MRDDAGATTELLRGKVVSRVLRNRPGEVVIEFGDGARLFVNSAGSGVELSIADAAKAQASFTRLQGRYLKFIEQYLHVHGVAPSELDMQSHFQVTPPSVHQMILTLERKGLIERVPGKARSIRVLVSPDGLPGGGG